MKHKIAVFRALYLGDMLLSVPALRALRRHFPASEITLIGLPWAASFVERYPVYLDRFVAFPGYPGLPEGEGDAERVRAFIAEQRAYGYDIAIQMHGSGRVSNAFVRELQAALSAGYFPEKDAEGDPGLSIAAPYPQERHEIYRNLGLTNLLGCRHLDPNLEFPLRDADFDEIASLLAALPGADVPRVGIHVGAKHPARRWSPASFAAVADALARDFGACIILTGSVQERSTVRNVIEHMSARPMNLVGETSLGGLAALLSTLDLFISNDTGPVHLAYALDTPSITLFGPTDYRRWRPLEQHRHRVLRVPVACSPCGYQICPIDHRCLARITPEQVRECAEECLKTVATQHDGGELRPYIGGDREASSLHASSRMFSNPAQTRRVSPPQEKMRVFERGAQRLAQTPSSKKGGWSALSDAGKVWDD